ncbi:hypothetical protein [Saezia sanguinis]|uniref:hypothetical protein n=1 Tax=Saezia sanguinis TaxID=1965230 RepID=UPI0030247A0C
MSNMNHGFIVTTYPEVENEHAHAYEFINETEFYYFVEKSSAEKTQLRERPKDNKEALAILFKSMRVRFCIVYWQQYQRINNWTDAFTAAAQRLGWLHPVIDFPDD